MVDSNYLDRYLQSFFVATSSMIAGLIYIPETRIETIFVTLIMISNCGVFGYTINLLGNILDELGKK